MLRIAGRTGRAAEFGGHEVPILRGSTSLGTTIRGLYEALLHAESVTTGVQRRRIEEHRKALKKAYPVLLEETPSDLAQYLEELDGVPQDDTI